MIGPASLLHSWHWILFTWFSHFVSNSINFPQEKMIPKNGCKKPFWLLSEVLYIFVEAVMNWGGKILGRQKRDWLTMGFSQSRKSKHQPKWQVTITGMPDNQTIWLACLCKTKFLSKLLLSEEKTGWVESYIFCGESGRKFHWPYTCSSFDSREWKLPHL